MEKSALKALLHDNNEVLQEIMRRLDQDDQDLIDWADRMQSANLAAIRLMENG